MSHTTAAAAMKDAVKTLIVVDLKAVLKDNKQTISGSKAVLQYRLIEYIDRLVAAGNILALNQMRTSLQIHSRQTIPAIDASMSMIQPRGTAAKPGAVSGFGNVASRPINAGLTFRPSPFYASLEPLSRPVDLAPYPNHRNQATITFQLSPHTIDRLKRDSTLRILLYCTPKGEYVAGNQSEISFPAQLEVKVNNDEVRANFKGLKNKAGSTRPADITAFVKKQPAFSNQILTTYALTQKAYTMVAMIARKPSIAELVSRIQGGRVIPKHKVLGEMQARANDPDIVVGFSVMSLKDPVSYARIAVPCRSDICNHHQCFDAASFLQLQEQAPTWTCPICNKVISFEALVVDQYFQDILNRTSRSTEKVTVQPDGSWAPGENGSNGSNGSGGSGRSTGSPTEYSDDDLVEVVKPIKRESLSLGSSALRNLPSPFAVPTPPRASPAGSSSTAVGTANVRPAKRKSEIIDLTSDDDEPAPKRAAYSTPTSVPDRQTGRVNGYHSNPNMSSSFGPRTNDPLRFQISSVGGSTGQRNTHSRDSNRSSSVSSANGGTGFFSNPNASTSSFTNMRPTHRPSPLSGSASAPINLTESPPQRQAVHATTPYPANTSAFGAREPFAFPTTGYDNYPISPTQPAHLSNNGSDANSGYGNHNPEQRNLLRQLGNGWQADRYG